MLVAKPMNNKAMEEKGPGEKVGLLGLQLSHSVFRNLEARTWGGENVEHGIIYATPPSYWQTEG